MLVLIQIFFFVSTASSALYPCSAAAGAVEVELIYH